MSAINLHPATPEQKTVLANLIQLYLYDMTEFMPFPVGKDGRFEYEHLDRFWRYPYLIMSDDEITGFALVIDTCPLTGRSPCWFMAEFFVLKSYRQRGVGRAAIELALEAHRGLWHVAVPHPNHSAQTFWRKLLANRAAGVSDIHFDDTNWRLYELNPA